MTLQLPHYEQARVMVVGDVMVDRYWQGSTSRISPEAPVPVVHIREQRELPGAAANVALNTQALGANTILLSLSGDDLLGDTLEEALITRGIDTHLLRVAGVPTISKLRVLSLHQQLIRLDFEEGFHQADLMPLVSAYQALLENTDVVILSDYGKGVLREAPQLIKRARAAGVPVLVDPKGLDFGIYQGATLLTPNRKEFEAVVGKCADNHDLVEKALKLMAELELEALLVTRGEEGMTLVRYGQEPLHLHARKQEVYDVTGAGDTVIGVLAASLAAGAELEQATALANLAAGIVVSKLGAATVSPPELRRALHDAHNMCRGILTEEEALMAVRDARAHGERVVVTNGCFDLLHAGHVAYLTAAKALGDHLLVAVNTDDSVAHLKGAGRPINPLEDRMAVLAGLQAVDWVVPFSEPTPERLITALLPDVLVKGGDYSCENIAGSKAVLQHGGQVKVLDFLKGRSSSGMIEKISQIKKIKKN